MKKDKTYVANGATKPIKFDGFSGGVDIRFPKPKYITRFKNVLWNKLGNLEKLLDPDD